MNKTLRAMGVLSIVIATAATAAPAQAASPATTEVTQFLAAHPAAHQLSANSVAWGADNDPVLVFPASGTASTNATVTPDAVVNNCPEFYSCVYSSQTFAGRRLQFRDCGYVQDLDDYGFDNLTRSWVNNRYIQSYLNYDRAGAASMIKEEAHAKSAAMGSTTDRQASSIYLSC